MAYEKNCAFSALCARLVAYSGKILAHDAKDSKNLSNNFRSELEPRPGSQKRETTMEAVFAALAWALSLVGGMQDECSAGYLYAPLCRADGTARCHGEPYVPQPGDIVFYDDQKIIWRILDRLACTGPPDHNGIVVALPDGSLALLESAPDGKPHVYLLDIPSRLRCFKGTIWVRRLKCPLSAEQSACLTNFALEQEGKRYAYLRLMLQITPFRARGPIRSHVLGHTFLHRHRWVCSEIVIAAGTAAGLFDPRVIPANIIYPRDIFIDGKYDLSCHWHEAALWRGCAAEGR